MSRVVTPMKTSSRYSIFFLFVGLTFGQPTLRLKIQASSNSEDALMIQDHGVRGNTLPRLGRTHVIVQFEQAPSADVLAALAARGAAILQDVPDNAVLVTMDASVALGDLGISSAVLLDPREKVSPLITDGDASSAGYYLVEFHPDVDAGSARRLILNKDLSSALELKENPDLSSHQWMVHIANPSKVSATLALLASNDLVAYVFPASQDLISGRRSLAYEDAMSMLGPVGQYIATSGDGWDGPGRRPPPSTTYLAR